MTIVLPLLIALSGVAAVAWCTRPPDRVPLAVLWGPAIGFGWISLLFYSWRLAGGGSSFFPWVLLALTPLLLWWCTRRAPLSLREPRPPTAAPSLLSGCVALVALVLASLELHQEYLRLPLGTFDAKAIWNPHALLLYRAEDDLAARFSTLVYGHPSYPLLLCAGLSAQFALLGGDNFLTPAVQSYLFTVVTAGAIVAALYCLGAGRWGAWAAALYLLTPALHRWGVSQCADIPLSYLVVVAATSLALYLTRGSRSAGVGALAGLATGMLPWTKNEGLLLAGILALSWMFVRWRFLAPADRPRLRPVALGVIPGLASLVLFKALWSPRDELADFAGSALPNILDLERWRIVTAAFRQELSPVGGLAQWGIVWIMLVGVALAVRSAWRGNAAVSFLGIVSALVLLTWFGVYLGTLHDPQWHLDTSFRRLLLQLLPVALVAVFAAAGRSIGSPTTAGRS